MSKVSPEEMLRRYGQCCIELREVEKQIGQHFVGNTAKTCDRICAAVGDALLSARTGDPFDTDDCIANYKATHGGEWPIRDIYPFSDYSVQRTIEVDASLCDVCQELARLVARRRDLRRRRGAIRAAMARMGRKLVEQQEAAA